MKTINGMIYSKTLFEGWKFRMKFEILFDNLTLKDKNIDVYTNCENKWEALEAMKTLIISKYITLKIVNWSSREQDELADKFIEEVLKDI